MSKLIAFLIFCAAVVPAAAQTYYAAQFAVGSGGGLRIETTITLVNLGKEVLNPARVTVRSYSESGAAAQMLRQQTLQGPRAVSEVQREIEGRGTAVVQGYSADGTLRTGWLEMSTPDSVAVEVLFSIYDAAGRLITATSVLPRSLVTAATLLVNVDAPRSLAGALAVLNPPDSTGPAVLAVEVFDAFGGSVGNAQITVQPGQRVAQNWTELVPALRNRAGFVGTAEVVSSVPVILLPLRQDGVDLTAQDVLPAR
jgi:hypothetical protein